jgi:electron transfer flavoprotein beta subunit
MRIVVCVKQISHTYARTGMDPERDFLGPEDEVFRVNPYDELAVAVALRTKELVGEGEINVLTLGPIIAEKELRRCMAMGADHLYQIDLPCRVDPWQKSTFLARAIKEMGADLVLCGKESIDSRNGQVGAFVAHLLAVPFVSCIRDISISSDKGSLEVQRSAGRGIREVIECPLPAVFSVDAGAIEPPFPTYEDKKQSQTLPVQRIIYDKDSVLPQSICTKTFPPRPRPKKAPAPDPGLDAFNRIGQLLTGSRVEKKGEMLRGSPESQVEGIISFLDQHGFLESLKEGEKGG